MFSPASIAPAAAASSASVKAASVGGRPTSFVGIYWDLATCGPPADQSALRVAQGIKCQFANQLNRYGLVDKALNPDFSRGLEMKRKMLVFIQIGKRNTRISLMCDCFCYHEMLIMRQNEARNVAVHLTCFTIKALQRCNTGEQQNNGL